MERDTLSEVAELPIFDQQRLLREFQSLRNEYFSNLESLATDPPPPSEQSEKEELFDRNKEIVSRIKEIQKQLNPGMSQLDEKLPFDSVQTTEGTLPGRKPKESNEDVQSVQESNRVQTEHSDESGSSDNLPDK